MTAANFCVTTDGTVSRFGASDFRHRQSKREVNDWAASHAQEKYQSMA
ncbi:hypothetical protein [Limnohabitans sp. 2KL-1]|nr:hypothetical protein [Limnohabitans sp. 2KL-1]